MDNQIVTTKGQGLNSLGVILGLSLIASSLIGALAFYKVKSLDNTLSVSGSAKRPVTSDKVKWTASFMRTVAVDELKTGYAQMASDLVLVKKFYAAQAVQEKDLVISSISMQQQYDANRTGPTMYTLTQTVELQSSEVAGITAMAQKSGDLAGQGVIFATQAVEYYYSKLPDLRVELLGAAIKDAKARAQKLAESSGKRVGSLKAAASGIVQVLPVNSVDVSDYGSYDTSKIEKEVMVTVKASFILE